MICLLMQFSHHGMYHPWKNSLNHFSAYLRHCTRKSKAISKLITLTSWCKAPRLCLYLQSGLVWEFLSTTFLTAAVAFVRSPFKVMRNRVRERKREQQTVGCFMGLGHTTTHLKINRQFYGVCSSSRHDWAFIRCFLTKHGSRWKSTNSNFHFTYDKLK